MDILVVPQGYEDDLCFHNFQKEKFDLVKRGQQANV